jgi:hypothetical protein
MTVEEILNSMNISKEMLLGGFIGTLAVGVLIFVAILIAAIYVYHALAWQTIGKKQKYKRPWLAWIPFANISMILQMGRYHWAWVFLFLVPILGWIAILVLITIAMWRIFEKTSYPAWLSLSYPLAGILRFFFIIYMVIIGLIAWGNMKKVKPIKKATKKKTTKKKK